MDGKKDTRYSEDKRKQYIKDYLNKLFGDFIDDQYHLKDEFKVKDEVKVKLGIKGEVMDELDVKVKLEILNEIKDECDEDTKIIPKRRPQQI